MTWIYESASGERAKFDTLDSAVECFAAELRRALESGGFGKLLIAEGNTETTVARFTVMGKVE